LEKAQDKEFLDKWNLNINLVRENEDDIKLASLYKFNLKEDEVLDVEEKRKKLENESIFENKMINNKKKISLNNSVRSTSTATTNSSSSSNSLSSLRKKLTKSIQEKKLNEICNGNDSIKKDLLFTIKKKPNDEDSGENTNKLSNIIRKVQTESTVKIGLVSTDYGDDSISD
jgi:hypothetical protein